VQVIHSYEERPEGDSVDASRCLPSVVCSSRNTLRQHRSSIVARPVVSRCCVYPDALPLWTRFPPNVGLDPSFRNGARHFSLPPWYLWARPVPTPGPWCLVLVPAGAVLHLPMEVAIQLLVATRDLSLIMKLSSTRRSTFHECP